MTDLEEVTQHLAAVRNSSPSELHTHFSRALRRFRFVARDERRALADDFRQWADAADGAEFARPYAIFLQGIDQFIAEELHASLQLIIEARAAFSERDDPDGLGLSAMLIGAIYRTFGNFDLALKVLFEAFELLKASGTYPIFLAATANSMGGIHLEMGHLDEALEMYNVTYEESARADDFYFGIYGLHGLGRVYMRQRNDAEATEMFHRALALAERNAHPLHISNSLTELASFHFCAGRLDEAEALSEQALDIRQQHHLLAGAVTNLLRLAEIQVLRARWSDARALLQRALSAAEELKVKPKIAQVHRQLSDLYERMRLPDKSLSHFKRFHELREQIEREDNARTLADAKAMFEAEQTRKENVVIKRQKAEIERTNRELRDSIDELTRAKIGRKAKALTLAVAIVLFIFQDAILGTALRLLNNDNYFLLLGVKMAIIFSLSPINKAIEHHLLKGVMRQERLRRSAAANAVASAA
ncbi:MAG TPA: tetratricopeptide repeat protein [Gemmatimonadaceae bacterium]|jgi:tetratricopeptide (TPR) repeat protein|nr:tetratricopeptide repeat protein [Gemmatimonadaceae bacterium]